MYTLKVLDKIQSPYLGHLYFHIQKQRKTQFKLTFSPWFLYWARFLGTNMADSNCSQYGSHVSINQE